MTSFLFAISWMWWNIGLAIIPVICALLMYHATSRFWQFFYGIVWLIFLPNTIYLFTDLIHVTTSIADQSFIFILLILSLYGILIVDGFISFFASMYIFDTFIN